MVIFTFALYWILPQEDNASFFCRIDAEMDTLGDPGPSFARLGFHGPDRENFWQFQVVFIEPDNPLTNARGYARNQV